MGDSPVTCVIERIAADDLAAVEPVFAASQNRIVLDLRRVKEATPEGVARLARMVRHAQRRAIRVEIVSVSPGARRALVAAGLHHLVSLSE